MITTTPARNLAGTGGAGSACHWVAGMHNIGAVGGKQMQFESGGSLSLRRDVQIIEKGVTSPARAGNQK